VGIQEKGRFNQVVNGAPLISVKLALQVFLSKGIDKVRLIGVRDDNSFRWCILGIPPAQKQIESTGKLFEKTKIQVVPGFAGILSQPTCLFTDNRKEDEFLWKKISRQLAKILNQGSPLRARYRPVWVLPLQ